jgi:hypothetical protein
MCKYALKTGISVHRGPAGKVYLPGTSRDSKRRLWKRSVFLHGGSARATWRECSFTGYSEGYIKEGSVDGHLSPQGPHWETWKGGSFTREFKRQ